MAFSTNQARQFYVVKEVKSTKDDVKTAGDIAFTSDTTGLYFTYINALGTPMRSDLMSSLKVSYVKHSDPATRKLKEYTITLDSSVNVGAPISGQDYILKVAFSQWAGMSDEDQYFKFGAVHGVNAMTAATFYKTLAVSLANNFSREASPLVTIYCGSTEIPGNAKIKNGEIVVNGETLTTSEDKVVIREVEQPWRRGVMASTPVIFTVEDYTITYQGDETHWATIEDTSSSANTVGNGKTVADMEYFYMGERGDQYRQIGWPNTIDTAYMVDPSADYYSLDIHYYTDESGVDVEKSEKDMLLVSTASLKTLAEKVSVAAPLSTFEY